MRRSIKEEANEEMTQHLGSGSGADPTLFVVDVPDWSLVLAVEAVEVQGRADHRRLVKVRRTIELVGPLLEDISFAHF
jgi:hypothetical protein